MSGTLASVGARPYIRVDDMNKPQRLFLFAAVLGGSALMGAPSFAQDDWHGAPHPASARHGAHPGAVHPGPFRPGALHVRFHPLHAVITAHRDFAHFTPVERAAWTHGRWSHRLWHGRWGWWWYAGGAWFWYNTPVYPYPTVVSSDYYEDNDDDQAGPATWYYCYNPAGYYPYVPRCNGPWRPVPGNMGGGYDNQQGGPDMGYGPSDEDNGPPPGGGYGPPRGPGGANGPPASMNDQGPPGSDQGPPGYYDQGPPGYDQGPPPGYDQGGPPGDDEGPPPGDDQGPPPNSER